MYNDGFDESNEHMYLLACAYLPEHWLRPPRIPLDDHINVDEQFESYARMF